MASTAYQRHHRWKPLPISIAASLQAAAFRRRRHPGAALSLHSSTSGATMAATLAHPSGACLQRKPIDGKNNENGVAGGSGVMASSSSSIRLAWKWRFRQLNNGQQSVTWRWRIFLTAWRQKAVGGNRQWRGQSIRSIFVCKTLIIIVNQNVSSMPSTPSPSPYPPSILPPIPLSPIYNHDIYYSKIILNSYSFHSNYNT